MLSCRALSAVISCCRWACVFAASRVGAEPASAWVSVCNPERLDDFRNVAAGDPVEEIANLREHQPGGGAGDNRGSRYRSKGKEELGPDSELAR